MYAGKVEICGVNTAQLPVLSEKQKTALLAAAHALSLIHISEPTRH